MSYDIYGPSVTYFQGKTVKHKIENVEPVTVPSSPKDILEKYKKSTLCCKFLHINRISSLKIISRQIIFVTGSMIKNRKIKSIEYGVKQVHKLHLQRGLKIMPIHADSESEPLHAEISDLGIYLNCASEKEHVPDIEIFNYTVK